MARQMKDSGVEWIGEIPEDWNVSRIKELFSEVNERCEDSSGYSLLSVSEYYGVAPRADKISDDEILTRAESLDGYKICHPNDIVMNIMLAWKRALGASKYEGIVSPAYCVYRPKVNMCVEYFHYLFRTDVYTNVFKQHSTGIIDSRLRLYPDEFFGLKCQVPPTTVQHRIAAFLDRRCAEIDAVIERTKATIEEYKKLKQAVITEAVTKGVRGERKMKDSGIEWIGEIAEEHPIIKLKYVCQILDQYRSPVTADQRSQNGDVLYDYYGASGPIDKIDGYTIDGHVMLIGEDGANLRLRNLPLMYEVNGKAWINNHAHILKPDDGTEFYYLFFALEALDINPYITGSAQPKLSQENLKNILIPMPTLDEQREITAFIRKRCSALDTLIAKKTALLTELETYKKSLIYEYVTGKKEVPACP